VDTFRKISFYRSVSSHELPYVSQSDLSLHGILQLVDSSSGRGNYNEYELDVSLSSALDALESELGDLDDIRETAKRHRVLE
jgi:cell division control protein 6